MAESGASLSRDGRAATRWIWRPKYGVDWTYKEEKYEAHAVIAKLTELLDQAPARLSQTRPS
jgi:hypothetical protein